MQIVGGHEWGVSNFIVYFLRRTGQTTQAMHPYSRLGTSCQELPLAAKPTRTAYKDCIQAATGGEGSFEALLISELPEPPTC